MYIYNRNYDKRGPEFERGHKGIWESLEGENGRGKYCNYTTVSKL